MPRSDAPAPSALTSAAPRRSSGAPPGARPRYLWPALGALAFYVAMMAAGSRAPFPTRALPLLTGLLLAAGIALQWLLWRVRSGGSTKHARTLLKLHTWLGGALPLVLLLHTSKLGRGALLALSLTFGANLAIGLANPTVTRLGTPRQRSIWLALHVGLSLITIPLLAIHVWTRLRYRFE